MQQICSDGDKFKHACLNNNQNEIDRTIEYLFDPNKDINTDVNNVKAISQYITGGLSYAEYKHKVKAYDNSTVCGLVWSTNYIAYRCRTCGISPCMSICAECFKNGDHEGHDYNMFRSGAGGACDCGDDNVMLKKGFCKYHGCDREQVPDAPNDLTICTDVMISNLLYRLIQYLRSNFNPSKTTNIKELIGNSQAYFEVFNELCSLGTAIRKIFVKYMLDDKFYDRKIKEERELFALNPTKKDFYLHKTFQNQVKDIQNIKNMDKLKYKNDLTIDDYTNCMHELLFWCIKYEFPEVLVKYLLNLLPENQYKIDFTKSFVQHYFFISTQVLHSQTEHISGRVIHISVQLFSNESMTIKALNEYGLLKIFISSLCYIFLIPDVLKKNEIQIESSKNKHMIVDVEHDIFQNNSYWSMISDLVNLLSHKQVTIEFLSNEDILNAWIQLITYFQSMNLNIRQLTTHVQYDQSSYLSSYSAELEFSSAIMWSFIQHLSEPNTAVLSLSVLYKVIVELQLWFEKIGLSNTSSGNNAISSGNNAIVKPNPTHLTFHLPLHRIFSVFAYNSLYRQNCKIEQILSDDSKLLIDLLAHPLQLQIAYYEICVNLWVRNGLLMKQQAMTYVDNHFSTSFIDADLFLIQSIASRIQPELFVKTYFERFYAYDYCKIVKGKQDAAGVSIGSPDPSQLTSLVIGALTFFAQIISIKVNLSLKDYELTRTEVVNLLCIADRSYSQTEENIPDACSLSAGKRFVDTIIKEVADYIQPSFETHTKNLRQGKYVPKDYIWKEEYDPLYVMLRSVKLREFQESFDRYCDFIKTKNLFDSKNGGGRLWPPFRLPKHLKEDKTLENRFNLLETKTLHGVLFSLLYRHLYDPDAIPEKMLYFVIYILELSIHIKEKDETESSIDPDIIMESELNKQSEENSYMETNYETWFNSTNIFENMCKEIPFVKYGCNEDEDEDKQNEEEKPKMTSLKNKILQLPPLKRVCAGIPFLQTVTGKTYKYHKIEESIISLLVKILHSVKVERKSNDKAAAASDSSSNSNFVLSKTRIFTFQPVDDSRIGDEFHFISNLLNKVASNSQRCKAKIEKCMEAMNIKKDAEESEDSKKKAKAKARQQKLMAQMASHQKAFLNFADTKDSEEAQTNEEEMSVERTYDCCICQIESPASNDKPIGTVTLVQSTSVTGYCDSTKHANKVPLNDNDKVDLGKIRANYEENRIEILKEIFSSESSKYSVNVGWKGGIFTQTCGHYLHFDCYNKYKETQTVQTQQNANAFAANEYMCPLCRQIGNCLLPIQSFKITKLEDEQITSDSILNILKTRPVLSSTVSITTAISDAFTSIFEATEYYYRFPFIKPKQSPSQTNVANNYCDVSDADTNLFITSVLRTQLEVTLLLKENPELSENINIKRYCFIPLFDVLASNCKLTSNDTEPHVKLWSMLTKPNLDFDYENSNDVPLLLRDPVSLLLLIVLNLPPRVERQLYQKVVNHLFDLVFIQSCLTYILSNGDESKERLPPTNVNNEISNTYTDYMFYIVSKLCSNGIFPSQIAKNFMNSRSFHTKPLTNTNGNEIEFIERLCLPFMKIASLLQSYLYEDDRFYNTFDDLTNYLNLKCNRKTNYELLSCETNEHLALMDSWLNHFISSVKKHEKRVFSLVSLFKLTYFTPNLLKLPPLYSELFGYYSHHRCNYCKKVPKEASICLVCGSYICYKASCCCDDMKVFNKNHKTNCGSGTLLILNISSTLVYIMRGQRFAAWASLYLDEHGEEDRDLRRGKPLFLCKQRYDLLKALWCSHAFDHQNIKWYNATIFIY